MAAFLVVDYGLGEPLRIPVDRGCALGVRKPRPSLNYLDSWHGLVGARSVALEFDDGADSITAPEFADQPSVTRKTAL